MSENKTAPHC